METKIQPSREDVGADVAKADFVGAINLADVEVKKLPHKKFPRSREGAQKFLAWCRTRLGVEVPLRVIMEATGLYSEQLADWILEIDPDCTVVLANPRSVSDFAKSHDDTKTDVGDARVLARYGTGRKLHAYIPLPEDQKPLRTLVRQRKRVVDLLKAERQRRTEYEGLSKQVTASQDGLIEQLRAEKEQLEKEISRFITNNDELNKTFKIYKQITGVGSIVAAVMLAELGDLRRFKSNKDLAAFAGLKPKEFKSGTSIHKKTRMSKRGAGYVRSMLYMAAMAAITKSNRFSRQYNELKGRGKTPMAALGATMRKILIMLRTLTTTGGKYQDNHMPGCGKLCSQTNT